MQECFLPIYRNRQPFGTSSKRMVFFMFSSRLKDILIFLKFPFIVWTDRNDARQEGESQEAASCRATNVLLVLGFKCS